MGGQGQLSPQELAGLASRARALAAECSGGGAAAWQPPGDGGACAAEVLTAGVKALAEQSSPAALQRLLRNEADGAGHLLTRLTTAFEQLWATAPADAAAGSSLQSQQPRALLTELLTCLVALMDQLFGEGREVGAALLALEGASDTSHPETACCIVLSLAKVGRGGGWHVHRTKR